MSFKTMYGDHPKAATPSGSRYLNEYHYKRDKAGRKYLTIKDEIDQHEKIQEWLEDVKMENILRRVTAGDTSVLRPQGIFADTTIFPTSMIEMQQHMQNLENFWGELPIDIKRKYHFDLDEFIGASGSEQWLKDMGYIKEPEQAIKTAEKVTEAITKPAGGEEA